MAKVKSSVAAAAREKARAAKAAVDAQRAEHDRLVEAATTDYYIAAEEEERAKAEVEAAGNRQVEALRQLVAAGLDNDTIVALTGCSSSAVRTARKKPTVSSDAEPAAGPAIAGDEV